MCECEAMHTLSIQSTINKCVLTIGKPLCLWQNRRCIMAKKRKPTKQPSARGHVEGNVTRLRLKQELIRVDKNGNPLNRGAPINTFSKDWLSGQLLSDISAPPTIVRRNSPPSNVTSINSARKPEKSKQIGRAHV